MSEKIDTRAVLRHLNDLGYTNIEAEQLKDFIRDLKKIIKSDKKSPEKENRPPKQISVHIFNKNVKGALKSDSNVKEALKVDSNVNGALKSVKGASKIDAKSIKTSSSSKQFLRQKSAPLRWNKSDPVALYQFYQSQWKKTKIPGEENRDELRWAVRARMLSGPKVEVKAKSGLPRCPWSR